MRCNSRILVCHLTSGFHLPSRENSPNQIKSTRPDGNLHGSRTASVDSTIPFANRDRLIVNHGLEKNQNPATLTRTEPKRIPNSCKNAELIRRFAANILRRQRVSSPSPPRIFKKKECEQWQTSLTSQCTYLSVWVR